MKIGVDAARKVQVEPIPAPLVRVAMHVVEAPRVGGVTADFGGTPERRSLLGRVVRLALEVCLIAVQGIAERGSGGGSSAGRVFPLRFGGQPKLPVAREIARAMTQI